MQCTLRTNPGRQQIVNQAPTQTATSSKNAWPRRLHALDASRGLAALTVVIWHWQHFFYTNTAPAVDFRRDSQPLYSALKLFYEQGKWGVEYFFILSGFIFFWIYHDAIKERSIRAKEFFIHRFSRLYPLHAVTLFIVALLQAYHTNLRGHPFTYPENDFYHLTLNLFFASHWGLQKGWSFNAPSWSVSVEILLYAAFFCNLYTKTRKTQLNICNKRRHLYSKFLYHPLRYTKRLFCIPCRWQHILSCQANHRQATRTCQSLYSSLHGLLGNCNRNNVCALPNIPKHSFNHSGIFPNVCSVSINNSIDHNH